MMKEKSGYFFSMCKAKGSSPDTLYVKNNNKSAKQKVGNPGGLNIKNPGSTSWQNPPKRYEAWDRHSVANRREVNT